MNVKLKHTKIQSYGKLGNNLILKAVRVISIEKIDNSNIKAVKTLFLFKVMLTCDFIKFKKSFKVPISTIQLISLPIIKHNNGNIYQLLDFSKNLYASNRKVSDIFMFLATFLYKKNIFGFS